MASREFRRFGLVFLGIVIVFYSLSMQAKPFEPGEIPLWPGIILNGEGRTGGIAKSVYDGSAGASLEVKNLRVEFLTGQRVRVRGQLRCNEMAPQILKNQPQGMDNPWSEVSVNIDFPHGKFGFGLLPDDFYGKGIKSEDRNVRVWLIHNGKFYEEGKKEPVFYNDITLLRPSVIDKRLDNNQDDGRWIAFDKTLEFKNIQTTDGLRYRVVIGWKLHYTTDRFDHAYFWVVYGPFSWGESPLCEPMLSAGYRRPAFFTEKGIVVENRAKPEDDNKPEGLAEDDQPPTEKVGGKRPKLVRPSKPPSHLEAVDASLLLQEKLTALPGVAGAGVGLPPGLALIRVSYAAGMKPEDITRMVADVALETAYGAPWVDSMQILTSGDQGSSTVAITWAPVAKYAAEEMTLQEFCKTWQVGGKQLVIPKSIGNASGAP